MSDLIFAPVTLPSLPIAGSDRRLPVNRIFCVGRNYEAHAKEMGVQVDREAPFYFTKSPQAAIESGSTVPYPPGTDNYHYEMELVVAIGEPGFRVTEAEAPGIIYGYACGLDMTRRDLQLDARAKGRPWDLGKDVEQSAVVSPIMPVSAVGHPIAGRIELRQNGETRQSADLRDLIWSVEELISHLSNYYHLKAGDLIFTGTPAGVGPTAPGDHLQGSIEGLGEISLQIGSRE
ncbi:FAA hydrolase family protein [Oleomonas cavernae]|uniref:FAA hydrolase family protein n=1 Tax=Oleomonas cavernae TaxID=2320859 RepID=A0A418W8L1_9PROT|nr:fumarylacetoacetate hydrolase family protein [Oleomonas cavernae]RJF86351.1 FAA hydrolase family protein [Oleomonas cavernae]